MSMLRVALPTGTLLPGACDLLREAGVATLQPSMFDELLLVSSPSPGQGSPQSPVMEFVKIRPTDVPVYVEMGACDVGVVGKDMLWESARDCYELVDLHFGDCRLVLAAPDSSPLAKGQWPPSLRVATKYPKAARRFFDRIGVAAELIKLHGSVELAPLTGLADAVLDITATGRTLRANRLAEVAEAGRSTARLIVNQASLKTRAGEVNDLASALRRAVEARATAARGAA